MYDEALKYYFKVDYLDPTNAKGGRGVVLIRSWQV